MDIFTLILWIGTLAFLIFSWLKDRARTKRALKMALKMGKGMAPSILSIVMAIGLILTLLPPDAIAEFMSRQSVFLATLVAALFGTVTLVPAFIAFPFVGTLVGAGVSLVPAVASLTTLTMVGIVTLPLEKKTFGVKFTVARNGLSFLFALLIALAMGVVM